jgi:Circularly permutated YpsA SLOG family
MGAVIGAGDGPIRPHHAGEPGAGAMLERVVSGGQSGADQAGWRAARALGFATGGWMPRGFRTEAGPRPDFAELYGAVEMPGGGYPERTRANARDSDATLWFGDADSPGGRTTLRACAAPGRPAFEVLEGLTRPSDVAAWIGAEEVRVLNVAGHRESTQPGIGERVERFLLEVLRRLAR